MAKLSLTHLLVFFLILTIAGCNAFTESAKKDTEEAILYDAEALMNKFEWTLAITKIEALEPTSLAKTKVKVMLASAYAGRCGLNLAELAFALGNPNPASDTFEMTLLRQFTGAAQSNVDDCVTAEGLMNGISDPLETDHHILYAFIEFAKLGNILAFSGDTDESGTVDGGFNACNNLTAANKAEAALALVLAYQHLNASGVSLISGAISSMSSMCTAADAIGNDICAYTSTSQFSANELKLMTGVINTNFIGVGACGDTSLVTCVCP